MAIITAVVTEDAKKYLPQLWGGIYIPNGSTVPASNLWDNRLKFFKVGEGGWRDPGTGAVPRTPSATLRRLTSPLIQDLDAIVDVDRPAGSQRYPSDGRAVFDKALVPSDFTFVSPSTIEVRCFLDFGEFNDDGSGNSPEIWEVGVYMDHPVEVGLGLDQGLLVAYGTFPLQTKTSGIQLENIVQLTLG